MEVEAAGGRTGGSTAADKEAKVQAGKWSRCAIRHQCVLGGVGVGGVRAGEWFRCTFRHQCGSQ